MNQTPFLYKKLHYFFRIKCKCGNLISISDFHNILGTIYHIPKQERYIVLKEMIKYKLMNRKNRNLFELRIFPSKIEKDLDRNPLF